MNGESAPKLGRIGAIGRKAKGVGSSQAETRSSPAPVGAEPANAIPEEEVEETAEEKADRRRAELKLELENKIAKGPAKKKRRL